VKVIPLLKQLSEAEGLTGREHPVCARIQEIWQPLVDEMHVDDMGNLIGHKHGAGPEPRPKLMLAAHMDEIGLIVTGMEKGFLRVHRVGGMDRRVMLGLEVMVHGQRPLPGIVAARPPHVLPPEARKKTVPWEELFVDVGLLPDDVERLVAVGDVISIRSEMTELQNRRVAGKAFDDRACVAIITLALEQLSKVRHDWDVYAVATVQEEVGLKGALTAAYGVAPDLAIALDVTIGQQHGVSAPEGVALGEGPALGIGPNFHPGLVARVKEVAEAHEIAYQPDPAPGRSGTDAWAIQVSREGVPTALLSLPLRYMHQPVETLDVGDVERSARLLAAFVGRLETNFLDQLTWKGEDKSE
jgi:endoglucanase